MKPILLSQGQPWDEEGENIYHRKLFNAPGLLKIMSGADRIGYVGISETANHDIEISRFCIDTAYQKNGIGRYVIEDRIFPIPEFKGKDFVLEVLRINPAQNLYKSLGFTIERENYKLLYYRRKAQ